jgi:toxin ParE1/3/4
MGYKIIISPRAQNEIENAIVYYALSSVDAPVNFIIALQKAYEKLNRNPLYGIRYKNVRALKISKFPYLIYFVVNEKLLTVKVLACFHGGRNPKRRPRVK